MTGPAGGDGALVAVGGSPGHPLPVPAVMTRPGGMAHSPAALAPADGPGRMTGPALGDGSPVPRFAHLEFGLLLCTTEFMRSYGMILYEWGLATCHFRPEFRPVEHACCD